ncbi:transcription elongation factor B polypeptide 3-like [Zingiber officinale]|uniref:transcription elongation factor B polypeptide 3-like n=1 Tax=Zingiber officinale TaxID=94328 RepID=UPI001C4CDC64|nr:transcription elongation factor B polypeptide 3-like [Zingiber officinale]
MGFSRKVPTLVDLCTQTAIANIRYIGDVGEVDLHLLKDILTHCNIDQLTHIENSTKGRDLSPVTDDSWKRFYELQFGVESANTVIKRMKQKKMVFKWRLLYQAKLKEREEAQNKVAEKLKQRYAETQAKKQSRQIQICSKIPPSSNKRSYWGESGPGINLSNVKGNLMKKAKLEYLHSHELKVHAQMKRDALQRNSFAHQSTVHSGKKNYQQCNSASSSRNVKPATRR